MFWSGSKIDKYNKEFDSPYQGKIFSLQPVCFHEPTNDGILYYLNPCSAEPRYTLPLQTACL